HGMESIFISRRCSERWNTDGLSLPTSDRTRKYKGGRFGHDLPVFEPLYLQAARSWVMPLTPGKAGPTMLPAVEARPFGRDLSGPVVMNDVIAVMLGARRAGMVGQNADPIAEFQVGQGDVAATAD